MKYTKIDLYKRYFENWNNQFDKILNMLYESMKELWEKYEKSINNLYEFMKNNYIWTHSINNNIFLDQIKIIIKYLEKWKDFLSNFNSWDCFIEWFVQFEEWLENTKDFWFKMIWKDLSKYKKVFEESEWVCFLSATLSDYNWEKSYILNEIAWDLNYEQFSTLKSPFDYEKNRKIIYCDEINIDDDSDIIFNKKAEITLKYIKKYWWKTLILTTSNKDKDKISNFLYKELNWEWIMIKKHEWWTMNSRMNKSNIQSMIENPKTVLIWSKSFMEWVDIPWENLSLVILWKLPFLPPRPFIEYQNNKPEYKKINNKYVYKFLCWISFKQAIWRLIRTYTDKWEILVLDTRINDNSWSFFTDYEN
jgi:Rad3-related DNA helicase